MAKRGRYAAIEGMGKYLGKIYFFIDDVYYRYDLKAERIDDGFPQPIAAWGFPAEFLANLDAAVNGQGPYAGKAYFFKNGRYIRYDWQREAVDEGFPAGTEAWALPDAFGGQVDAALNGSGEYAGKSFFFRGRAYARYDWESGRIDEGYPQDISAWALPAPLDGGVDAAFTAPSNYPSEGGEAPDTYQGKAWFFRSGQYARYDWPSDQVEAGFLAPVNAWGLRNPGDGWCLGALSVKYETGGRGPGTVSTGAGDAGGVSYGSYQMTSQPHGGTVAVFVGAAGFPWRDRFAGTTPGTAEFSAHWKALAAEAPDAFQEVQHAFIGQTHYTPLARRLAAEDGLDIALHSRALQDVVWSTAVQHGPRTPVVRRALQRLATEAPLWPQDPSPDRHLIGAIYAERGKRGADGKLDYFRSCSRDVQEGLTRRFLAEEREALRMLEAGA